MKVYVVIAPDILEVYSTRENALCRIEHMEWNDRALCLQEREPFKIEVDKWFNDGNYKEKDNAEKEKA